MELAGYGVTVNAIAPAALTRMTENLGMGQAPDEVKDKMDPKWIAPLITWLASPESKDVTGRVFDITGMKVSVSEGWHRGPSAEPVLDPEQYGPVILDLVSQARPNADMSGNDKKEG